MEPITAGQNIEETGEDLTCSPLLWLTFLATEEAYFTENVSPSSISIIFKIVCFLPVSECLRVVCFTEMITPPCDNTSVCLSDKARLS